MNAHEEKKDHLDVLNPLHVQHLSEMMYQYQIDNKYCDTMIQTTSGLLFAHSVVLASASQKMKSLLHINLQSDRKSQYVIDLQKVECDSFSLRPILQFCYTGKFKLCNENVIQNTIELATYLDIKLIVEVCTLRKEQIQTKDVAEQLYVNQEVDHFKSSEHKKPMLQTANIISDSNESLLSDADKEKTALISADNHLNFQNDSRTLDISQFNCAESEINLNIMADVCSQKRLTDSEKSLITDIAIQSSRTVLDKERHDNTSRHTAIEEVQNQTKYESDLLDKTNFNTKFISTSSGTKLLYSGISKPLISTFSSSNASSVDKLQLGNNDSVTKMLRLCEMSSNTSQNLESVKHFAESAVNVGDTVFETVLHGSETVNEWQVQHKSDPLTPTGQLPSIHQMLPSISLPSNKNISSGQPLDVINPSLRTSLVSPIFLNTFLSHNGAVDKSNKSTLSKDKRNIPAVSPIVPHLLPQNIDATLHNNKEKLITSDISKPVSSHSKPLLHKLLTIPKSSQELFLPRNSSDIKVLKTNMSSMSSNMYPSPLSTYSSQLSVQHEPVSSIFQENSNKGSVIYVNTVQNNKKEHLNQRDINVLHEQRQSKEKPTKDTVNMSKDDEISQLQDFSDQIESYSECFENTETSVCNENTETSVCNEHSNNSSNELRIDVDINTNKVCISQDSSEATSFENSLKSFFKSDHSYVSVNSTVTAQSSLDHNYTICEILPNENTNVKDDVIGNQAQKDRLIDYSKELITDRKEISKNNKIKDMSNESSVHQGNIPETKNVHDEEDQSTNIEIVKDTNESVIKSPTLYNKTDNHISIYVKNSPAEKNEGITEVKSTDSVDTILTNAVEERNQAEKCSPNVSSLQETNCVDYQAVSDNEEQVDKTLMKTRRKRKSQLIQSELQMDKRKKMTSKPANTIGKKSLLKKKLTKRLSKKMKPQKTRKKDKVQNLESYDKEQTDTNCRDHNKADDEQAQADLTDGTGTEKVPTSSAQENEIIFKCKLCPMKYEVERELLDHMKHHTNRKKNYFTCSICGLKFPNTVVIQQHRKKSHVLPFTCPEKDCGIGFDTEEKLLGHRHSKHNMSLSLLETYFPYKYKLLKCKFEDCKYESLDDTTMKYHVRVTHGKDRPHTCDICGIKFKTRTTLNCHKRNIHGDNNKKHTCSQCGKDFKTNSSMVQHKKRVHEGVKEQFPCSKCDFIGYDKRKLLSHMWAEHDILPPEKYNRFECSECGYKCLQKGAFQIHMRRHTGERCFICEICGRSYVSASELHSHTEYHKDPAARKFKCDQCTFCAVTMIKLKRHVQAIHTNPEEKPYVCEHEKCEYRTNSKGNLVIHIRNIHKMEVETRKLIQRYVLKTGRGQVNPKISTNSTNSNTSGQKRKKHKKDKVPKKKVVDQKLDRELDSRNTTDVSQDLSLLMPEELTTGPNDVSGISMLRKDCNIDNPQVFLHQSKMIYNLNKGARNLQIQPKTTAESIIQKKMVSIIKPSLASTDLNSPMFIIPTTSENGNMLHIPFQAGLVEPVNSQFAVDRISEKTVNNTLNLVTSSQEVMTSTLVYTLPQVPSNSSNTLLNLSTLPTTTTPASHMSLDVGHTNDGLTEFKDTGLLTSFLNDPQVIMMNPQPEDLSVRPMTDDDRSMTEQLLGVDGVQNYTFLDLN